MRLAMKYHIFILILAGLNVWECDGRFHDVEFMQLRKVANNQVNVNNAPQNVAVSVGSSGSMEVTWEIPYVAQKSVDGYTVHWNCTDNSGSHQVDNNTFSYMIEGLADCELCDVFVNRVSGFSSQDSQAVRSRTISSPAGPDVPAAPITAVETINANCEVTITWEYADTSCDTTDSFIVSWTCEDKVTKGSVTVSCPATSVTLDGLIADQECSVSVEATNCAGASTPFELPAVGQIPTSSKPEGVEAISEQCTVNVNWEYDNLDCSLGQFFEVAWQCDDNTNGAKKTDCSLSTSLTGVSPGVPCDVYVTIANCAGTGLTSDVAHVASEKPTTSPAATVTTTDCVVSLAWTYDDHTCEANETFVIKWYCGGEFDREVNCGTFQGDFPEIPYDQNCEVAIAFKNCAGTGPLSSRIPVPPQTQPVPSIVDVSIDTCKVTVTWTNDGHKCDNEEKYILDVTCENSATQFNTIGCVLNAELSGFIPNAMCNITVTYVNCAGAGNPSSPFGITSQLPKDLVDPTITTDDCEVTVDWSSSDISCTADDELIITINCDGSDPRELPPVPCASTYGPTTDIPHDQNCMITTALRNCAGTSSLTNPQVVPTQAAPVAPTIVDVSDNSCEVNVTWTNEGHRCDKGESYTLDWSCDDGNSYTLNNTGCVLSAQLTEFLPDTRCDITVTYENCAEVEAVSSPAEIAKTDCILCTAAFSGTDVGCCMDHPFYADTTKYNYNAYIDKCEDSGALLYAELNPQEYFVITGKTITGTVYVDLTQERATIRNFRKPRNSADVPLVIANGNCQLIESEYGVFNAVNTCQWQWGIPKCCIQGTAAN